MSTRIYKHTVPIDDHTHDIELRDAAYIHAVGYQDGAIVFWASHQDGEVTIKRHFHVVGTGHELPADTIDICGATQLNPPFVWHLVERKAGGTQ